LVIELALLRRHELATQAMGDAFDCACCLLGDVAMLTQVREIMANRIIEEANSGERDPGQLCAWAIIQVGDSGGSNIET
jgi:hypothetical protein